MVKFLLQKGANIYSKDNDGVGKSECTADCGLVLLITVSLVPMHLIFHYIPEHVHVYYSLTGHSWIDHVQFCLLLPIRGLPYTGQLEEGMLTW